jgi:voltage-gated potassium channel
VIKGATMSNWYPGTSHKVSAFQAALLILTLLLLCSLVADTVFVLPKEVSDLIHIIDTIACCVFFADFCVRLHHAESKRDFLKWGWIDLIACIPNLEFMRWGRMVRVLRIIRLLRGVRSVQKALGIIFQDRLRSGVVSVIFAACLMIAFASVSILVCERQADGNIKTAEDALWWSVTTMTTVGYGDKFPVTTEGRVIGVVLMVGGVSMFGCLSGLAASFFLGLPEGKTIETKEIMIKLDQLQSKIDDLRRQQEKQGEGGSHNQLPQVVEK